MKTLTHFVAEHLQTDVLLGVIIILLLAVISLVIALFRKEKALMIKEFTIGTLGIQLQYEINKDKKMLLLVEENILLKKQLEAVKTSNRNLKFGFLAFIIILWVIMFADKILAIFKPSKKDSENDKKE